MLKISDKGERMPASPIRKLVPYAEAAVRAGKTVYHLNIGQPDIETPREAIEAIQNIKIPTIEYTHSAGFESYRKGLVEYYRHFGIDITHEDMLVTTGGSEALLFAMMTCFNEGDEIIVPEPFYANYNAFAEIAGVTIRPITSSIEEGFKLPSIEEFEDLINENTGGIMICNPGNPTGVLYTPEEMHKLRQIVMDNDLYLFVDEVYREFCYDGAKPISALQLEGIEPNVVVVDSVSKRYSMCGARIGVMVSRNHDIIQTALKFAQARLSPPTLGQIAAEAALKTPQSYFENVQLEYVKRRDILLDGLNHIEGVFSPVPGGAFYTIARLPVHDAEHFCRWMLESFDYNGETVMMAPATGFYATPGLGKDEVRIAYVLNEASLRKALKCLEEGLKAYPRIKEDVRPSEHTGRM